MGPAYGGPTKTMLGLAPALLKENVSVDIATTNDNGAELLQVPLGVAVNHEEVKIYHFPKQDKGSFVFSWPLTEWLWQHQRNYDLVHVHSVFSYPTLAASRIARRLNQPYIITPHGMAEPWCLSYKAWKKKPYLRLIEHRTLSRSAALHALVVEEGRNLRALKLRAPTFVLPNGVTPEEFRVLHPRQSFESVYPETRGKRIVLFMGRIDPKKGLDLLIEAFAATLRNESMEDLHLVIAGPDLLGYRATVEKLIKEQNIQHRVTFTGMLSGEIKLAALQAAELFVLPSRSEGFSIAILEALAAGSPVIITRACNFPQVAEARAGKVIPTDAGHLTQALSELLQNEEMRREMGVRGRQLIHEKYNWPVIAAQMSEVYEDILQRRQSSAAWAS